MHEIADPERQAAAEAIIQLPKYQDIEEEYTVYCPEVKIFKDANKLFSEAADLVAETLQSYESPIFSLPTGETPGRLYESLRKQREVNPKKIDFSHAFVRGLDEYWDMQRRYGNLQKGSFREYFETIVYGGKNGLNVLPSHRLHPNIQALDPFVDAAVFEKRQRLHGRAHLAVLGMGRNGHIAFNEPGSPRYSRSRLVTISEATREVNKGSFNGDVANVPEHAITQGVGNILESERIAVLIVGEHKAEAFRRAIDEAVSAHTPASWLRTHPAQQVTIFADEAAASRLPL